MKETRDMREEYNEYSADSLRIRAPVCADSVPARQGAAGELVAHMDHCRFVRINECCADGASSDHIMSHATHGMTDAINGGNHAHSSMVDTQSAMSSVTAHSPKAGTLKGTGQASLVEWQELASRSQQTEKIVWFSRATTSNTVRTEHDGSGINSSINSSEAHNQPEDSADIARAIQTEVIKEQDLSKVDQRTEISRQMNEGGQEFVIRRTQSSGETLAKASASESAGIDIERHLREYKFVFAGLRTSIL
ncbi:hypothetical protein BJ741DRAFT_143724 [Chytriomyces cf. hyalinus JEL632]|nr:hypothetical protein BJ741DRAFT_143724 [Chytriomyces cf. hyalinus JEL632]